MRRSRLVLAGVLAVTAAVAGVAGYRASRPSPATPADADGPLGYPPRVDLNELRPGREVATDIPVRNRSDVSIRLFGFRASCGCMTPARRTPDGRVEGLGQVVLAPGEAATLVLSTRTAPGETTFAHRLGFRTDHPDVPEVGIVVSGRVFRGVVATPEVVAFDPVYPGEAATATVRVTDLRPATARTPLRFRVDGPPVHVQDKSAPTPGVRELELRFDAPVPGPVSGRVTVTAEDGTVLGVIPYSGQVRPVAELIPSVLLLPRPGNPDPNEARVRCRSRAPVRLIVGESPAGLIARCEDDVLIVRRVPGKVPPGTHTIHVRAVGTDDREYPLALWVTCSE